MAVIVSFMKPGGLGSIHAVGVGHCRLRETLAVNGTSGAAQDGEIALVLSTEATAVLAAHGSVPDAAAATATAATSAGYGLPAGVVLPIAVRSGDKINIKAIA